MLHSAIGRGVDPDRIAFQAEGDLRSDDADVNAVFLGRPVDAQLRHCGQTVVTDIFARGASQGANAGERLRHAGIPFGQSGRRVHTHSLRDVVCFQGAILSQEVDAVIEHVE